MIYLLSYIYTILLITMEIKECGSMMYSNDQRFVEKFLNNINGKYWIYDYKNKTIKHGNFLNNKNLNGNCILITYDNYNITITYGEFTNGNSHFSLGILNSIYTLIESQNPYFIYNNNKINADGTFINEVEYYCFGIKKKYKYTQNGPIEIENSDVFIRFFIKPFNGIGIVVTNAIVINELPITSHEMYEAHYTYPTLQQLLEDIFI